MNWRKFLQKRLRPLGAVRGREGLCHLKITRQMDDNQPKRDDQILPVFRPRPPSVQDAVVVGRVVFLYRRAGGVARGGAIG